MWLLATVLRFDIAAIRIAAPPLLLHQTSKNLIFPPYLAWPPRVFHHFRSGSPTLRVWPQASPTIIPHILWNVLSPLHQLLPPSIFVHGLLLSAACWPILSVIGHPASSILTGLWPPCSVFTTSVLSVGVGCSLIYTSQPSVFAVCDFLWST